MATNLPATNPTAAALRAWARGMYTLEAAAELLIRAFGGRLLRGAWIAREADGWTFVDLDHLDEAGVLSSGERHVLDVAVSLISDDHPVVLAEVLPGLDRDAIALVLAAVAHATGSHEHSRFDVDPDTRVMRGSTRLGSLYPWPTPADQPSGGRS